MEGYSGENGLTLKDGKEPVGKDVGKEVEWAQQVQRPWAECPWHDRATKSSPLRLEHRVWGKVEDELRHHTMQGLVGHNEECGFTLGTRAPKGFEQESDII